MHGTSVHQHGFNSTDNMQKEREENGGHLVATLVLWQEYELKLQSMSGTEIVLLGGSQRASESTIPGLERVGRRARNRFTKRVAVVSGTRATLLSLYLLRVRSGVTFPPECHSLAFYFC